MYFAGIATVVTALVIGFGSATLLTSTTGDAAYRPIEWRQHWATFLG